MTISKTTFISNTFAAGTGTATIANVVVNTGAKLLRIWGFADTPITTIAAAELASWNGINAVLKGTTPADASNSGNNGRPIWLYEIQNPTPGTGTASFRNNSASTKNLIVEVVYATNSVNSIINTGANFPNAVAAINSTVASELNNSISYAININNKLTTEVTETGGQTILQELGSSGVVYMALCEETGSASSSSASWTVINTAQPGSTLAVNTIESAFVIDSFSNPVIPQSFIYTTTGATSVTSISAAGVTATNISDLAGDGTGVFPGLSDDVVYPRLPATDVVVTLNSGTLSAITTVDISLPLGTKTVTFSGVITNNPEYIGYWFNLAGNPIVAGEAAIYPDSITIFPDGSIDAAAAGTYPFFMQRANGRSYQHSLVINEA